MSSLIFITGGAGFIGSHVVDECLARGYEVLVYDNFVVGKRGFLPKNKKVRVVKADLLDRGAITTALQDVCPTYVIHLAALHYIPYCDTHPQETIDVNIKGTQSLLDALSGCSELQKVLIASSAAVYEPSENLHTEESSIGPTDIYGISKYTNELQARMFYRRTGVHTVVTRIFNAYGTRETNPHLIPEIITQIQKGVIPIKLGNVTTKRSYISVCDLARGLVDLIESEHVCGCEAYNIGSKKEYSAEELLHILSEVYGKAISYTSTAERQRKSDRPRLYPSLEKIENAIGWYEKDSMGSVLRDLLTEKR